MKWNAAEGSNERLGRIDIDILSQRLPVQSLTNKTLQYQLSLRFTHSIEERELIGMQKQTRDVRNSNSYIILLA